MIQRLGRQLGRVEVLLSEIGRVGGADSRDGKNSEAGEYPVVQRLGLTLSLAWAWVCSLVGEPRFQKPWPKKKHTIQKLLLEMLGEDDK